MNLSWELVYPLGGAALFAALAYGAWRYHTRNRANDRITEQATHDLYDDPKTYPAKRPGLEDQVRPD